MKLSLLTWNSHNINSSPFNSYILPGQLANLSNNPVLVNRVLNYPYLSTVVKNSNPLIIGITISAGQNINTNRELIKQYFFGDDDRHTLVAQDENNGNVQYYRTGIPVRFVQESTDKPNSFYITIQTEYPYWQLVTATADSWTISASGDSDAITNAGNINVKPVFTITPTTTKSAGLKYRRYAPVYNNLNKSYLSPYDITDGGVDVQTLINNNKMQASGNDFRVWQDGSFADRWLYGVDSDSDPGKAWINLQLSQKKEGTILSTFDSDDTTLYLSQTRANLAFLRELKTVSNNTLLIESEAITYTASNIDLLNYKITGIVRNGKTSTAVSHSAGVTVRHIEHDIWLLYGDSDMLAQSVDSDFQPILDLSSTNNLWSYTTNFYDKVSDRPGSWTPEVLSSKTGLSYNFTDSYDTFTDPSTKLGLAMVGTTDFQVANEAGTLDWLFYHPAGMTNVKYSGDYRTVDSDNSWPATVGLQKLQSDATWILSYTDTGFPPQSSDSWVAFDSYDISLSGTYETIRFVMDGQLNSVVNAKAEIQFDNVYLTFDSDNTPTSTLFAENSINFFDFVLTNATTGEYIKVQTPCPVNTALTIDCENKIAYLADGSRVNVTLSSNREAWLDLKPGVNNLNYVDTGTVAVNVVITHRDRIL